MNIMTVDNYHARIEYNADTDMFRGEILGLNGGADFYGRDPDGLRSEFRNSLKVFLDVCREKGIAPRRHYSEKIDLDIPHKLHERLAAVAEAEGKTVRSLAQEALQNFVQQYA
jgi:predicted HicB family RNase H-like nuclease